MDESILLSQQHDIEQETSCSTWQVAAQPRSPHTALLDKSVTPEAALLRTCREPASDTTFTACAEMRSSKLCAAAATPPSLEPADLIIRCGTLPATGWQSPYPGDKDIQESGPRCWAKDRHPTASQLWVDSLSAAIQGTPPKALKSGTALKECKATALLVAACILLRTRWANTRLAPLIKPEVLNYRPMSKTYQTGPKAHGGMEAPQAATDIPCKPCPQAAIVSKQPAAAMPQALIHLQEQAWATHAQHCG